MGGGHGRWEEEGTHHRMCSVCCSERPHHKPLIHSPVSSATISYLRRQVRRDGGTGGEEGRPRVTTGGEEGMPRVTTCHHMPPRERGEACHVSPRETRRGEMILPWLNCQCPVARKAVVGPPLVLITH